MSPLRLRPFRPLLAALGLAVVLGGCDYGNNDDLVVIGNDIIVRNFTVTGRQYEVGSDGAVGSYQRDVPELTSEVAEDGAVLLYAGDEILFGAPQGSWTALPTTIGYDEDGDGLVDITLAFTFSYDLEDLYIDVVASSPIDFEQTLPETDFRLVLIPGDLYVGNARAGVDFSDYESVSRAFALPE